jgi:hypothetical protein
VTAKEWGGEPKRVRERYLNKLPADRARQEERRAIHTQRFDRCYNDFQRAILLRRNEQHRAAWQVFLKALKSYPRGLATASGLGCARRLILNTD